MASLIRENRKGRVNYRVQFRDADGTRRTIRLGVMSDASAQFTFTQIDQLIVARMTGQPLPSPMAKWLAKLGRDLHEKLANAGLAEPREQHSSTLGEFISSFIVSRKDAEPNTVRNWRNSQGKLVEFFGESREMRTIRNGDADEWRQSLVNLGLAGATISKAVKHAKQFFRAAERKGLVDKNPFADVVAGGERNDERKEFIDLATTDRVLNACPSVDWRLIVALCRFGGLRCPSEVLSLGWDDINWAESTMLVKSRKTKRYGKGSRVVPIFPEVLVYLAEAFEQAADGEQFVIRGYRDTQEANLRTQLLRIIKRAGIAPWERLFHNLRASCQTELEDIYPTHVVCTWLGNSEAVATKHYLTVTTEHIQSAIIRPRGGARGGALSHENLQKVVQQVVPHEGASRRKEAPQTQESSVLTAKDAANTEDSWMGPVPPRGVEPLFSD